MYVHAFRASDRPASSEEIQHSPKHPGQEHGGYEKSEDFLLSIVLLSYNGKSLVAELNARVQRGPLEGGNIFLKALLD